MECKTDFRQSFQPVTFTITCQTPEDLVALWQRFRMVSEDVLNITKSESEFTKLNVLGSECMEVWKQVDNVVHQLGWR